MQNSIESLRQEVKHLKETVKRQELRISELEKLND